MIQRKQHNKIKEFVRKSEPDFASPEEFLAELQEHFPTATLADLEHACDELLGEFEVTHAELQQRAAQLKALKWPQDKAPN